MNSAGSTSIPAWESLSSSFGRNPVGARALRRAVPDEDVLQRDDVPFHALTSVTWVMRRDRSANPGLVDDQVDRRGDLLADRAHRQVHAGHQHHRLDAGQRVARAVGCTVQIDPS